MRIEGYIPNCTMLFSFPPAPSPLIVFLDNALILVLVIAGSIIATTTGTSRSTCHHPLGPRATYRNRIPNKGSGTQGQLLCDAKQRAKRRRSSGSTSTATTASSTASTPIPTLWSRKSMESKNSDVVHGC